MAEIPSHPRSPMPPARWVERWVLQAWIAAIGIALLWALLG